MDTRDQAIQLLKELKNVQPQHFFDKYNIIDKGIFFILGYLAKTNDEVIAGDLAKELHVSTARIATLLKKMESRALIRRYISNEDARKTVVILTEKGRNMVRKMDNNLIEGMMKLINEIGFEDMQEFIRISNKIKIIASQQKNFIIDSTKIDE